MAKYLLGEGPFTWDVRLALISSVMVAAESDADPSDIAIVTLGFGVLGWGLCGFGVKDLGLIVQRAHEQTLYLVNTRVCFSVGTNTISVPVELMVAADSDADPSDIAIVTFTERERVIYS